MPTEAPANPGRKRVLVLGAGFGGLTCAQALKGLPVDVTLEDALGLRRRVLQGFELAENEPDARAGPHSPR